MPHRVLTYRGPNRADGYPASDQTDEDLALLARERGLSVDKLIAGYLAFHYPDGTPLYSLDPKASDTVTDSTATTTAARHPTPTEAPKRKG